MDSIEHGCYLDEDPELIPMMAERGTFLVPTLTVYVYHSESKAPHVRERARALREHHLNTIRRAMAAGVKVVAGTDAGGHGHPPNAMEIEYLVAAGLTPMQAIQAATGWAAECLGLEHQIGAIEKGRRADLVVVDGDPLADVRVLQVAGADPAGAEGRTGRGASLGRTARATCSRCRWGRRWGWAASARGTPPTRSARR